MLSGVHYAVLDVCLPLIMKREFLLWKVSIYVLRSGDADDLITHPIIAPMLRQHAYERHHLLAFLKSSLRRTIPSRAGRSYIFDVTQSDERDTLAYAFLLELLRLLIWSIRIAGPEIHLQIEEVQVEKMEDHLPYGELCGRHYVLLDLISGWSRLLLVAHAFSKGAEISAEVSGEFPVEVDGIGKESDHPILDQGDIRREDIDRP